jgi:hypothetical protein
LNPTELTERLIEVGESWADLNAAASLLEETRKTVLAEISVGFIRKGDTATAAEKKAYASERYKKHVDDMVHARREANRARVKYDSGKAFSGLVRTQESTRRAEMQLR